MPSLFGNLIVSFLTALLIIFAVIAIYYRDKYFKTKDELLDLADAKGFFSKKSTLMRQDEQQFFAVLMKLYGEKYFIFPQVRLAAILDIKNDVKEHDNLYREIDHYSIDFILFERNTTAPLLAIELNGPSHFQMNRRNRDQKISNILTKAGIKFIAVPVAYSYDENALRQQIDPLLIQ